MSKISDVKGLMVDCLQDLYSNEVLTVGTLPVLLDHVTSPELRSALVEHRTASEEQVRRLQRIAEEMGEKAKGPDSLWASGILGDAKRDTEGVEPGPLLDAALIGAVRKLEGAEVVSYETAIGVARALEMQDAAALLVRTRAEGVAMDATLQGMLVATLGGVGVV
jgi:ferritin-like metal-binding protein YciE